MNRGQRVHASHRGEWFPFGRLVVTWLLVTLVVLLALELVVRVYYVRIVLRNQAYYDALYPW